MCQFCENPTSHAFSYNEKEYEFCSECWEKAKICDFCGNIHVYGKDLHHVDNIGFICDGCRGGGKPCAKCGDTHYLDGEFCSKHQGWFRCEGNGNIYTKSRSLIPELIFLQYQHGLPGRNISNHYFISVKDSITPVDIHQCIRCEAHYTGPGAYCPECAAKRFICDHDGTVDFGERFVTAYGTTICSINKRMFYTKCRGCDLLFKNNDIHNGYCKSCRDSLHECDCCHHLVTHTTKIKEWYDINICGECKSEKLHICNVCGTPSIDCLDGACPKCRQDYGLHHIRYYSTKMPVKIRGKELHFGIENEISCGETNIDFHIAASALNLRFNSRDLILKSDSSVYNGFECVFRPMTFAEFKAFDLSKAFPPMLVKHDSCGMHVHMNKSAFTTTHLYKFIEFIHTHDAFMEKIAERASTQYCSKNTDNIKKAAKSKKTNSRGRVNMQPAKTIEIRMFAGVVDEASFRKNVEFLDALYYYTKIVPLKGSSIEGFRKFVDKNKYPNLKKFLKGV
jgi:hypothetical protein